MTNFVEKIRQAEISIRKKLDLNVDAAVILGSGLSELQLNGFKEIVTLDYSDIQGLPSSTAPSHKGKLQFLQFNKKVIAVCAGRHHLYEGYSAQDVSMLIYLLKAIGTRTLFVTNAAGALNPEYQPSDVMIITDHINLTGCNPLTGQNNGLGVRFPDMSNAYSRSLTKKAVTVARDMSLNHHTGIYAGVTGPSLETSAERRMLRMMGADAVGMSTVIEVIAANHCEMSVLGLSAITNLATGDLHQQADNFEQVLENAAIAGKGIKKIIEELVVQI